MQDWSYSNQPPSYDQVHRLESPAPILHGGLFFCVECSLSGPDCHMKAYENELETAHELQHLGIFGQKPPYRFGTHEEDPLSRSPSPPSARTRPPPPAPRHRRSRSPRHRHPHHHRRSTSSPRRSRTPGADTPPPGTRPPRLVVCSRFAGAPPLGEMGRGSEKGRRGAHGAHLRGDAHPHPRRTQRRRPGGHHAASGMGGPPPRCGPGPPSPLHLPSPPPMAPGHPTPGLGHRRPLPTPPPPHQEGGRTRARGGQGTARGTQAGGHGGAPSEGRHP